QIAEAPDFAFQMAKAIDIIGNVKTPEDFLREATNMTQVITAFQGRINASTYQQVFAYSRQAAMQLDDRFKYDFLPTLMLEYSRTNGGGGGSRGVGPMIAAMYRFTNQGYVNKKSMGELVSLGLVDPKTALQTTTSGTTVGAMKGAGLAAKDPFLWIQDVVMPAIYKKYGKDLTQQQIATEINSLVRGNQMAAAA